MLTVEHIKVRRRAGVVQLVPHWGIELVELEPQLQALVESARGCDGCSRAELSQALQAVPLPSCDVRARRAFLKVIEDACSFDVATTSAAELRSALFARAAEARAAGVFDRDAVLRAIADDKCLTTAEVERAMFADLKDAQRVATQGLADASVLLATWEQRELQAVLLRAVRVRFVVRATPAQLRALLRAVKFHQLLFDVIDVDDGIAIEVQGPMALFAHSLRYGVKLATLLDAALDCTRLRLEADVTLRRHGAVERFTHDCHVAALNVATAPAEDRLLQQLEGEQSPWRPRVAFDVLRVPGGVIVPDLVLEHAQTHELVFVEVMGFWSRDAVWKRVQWVQQGLPFRVVFCVSERLRVSSQALPTSSPSALYVYKGAIIPSRLLERVRTVSTNQA